MGLCCTSETAIPDVNTLGRVNSHNRTTLTINFVQIDLSVDGTYTVYTFKIHLNDESWNISKRFRDFLAYKKLLDEEDFTLSSPFPDATFCINSIDPKGIKLRSHGILRWLRELGAKLTSHSLYKQRHYANFFECNEHLKSGSLLTTVIGRTNPVDNTKKRPKKKKSPHVKLLVGSKEGDTKVPLGGITEDVEEKDTKKDSPPADKPKSKPLELMDVLSDEEEDD